MSPFAQKLFNAVQTNDATVLLQAFKQNRATFSRQHVDSSGSNWLHRAAAHGSLGFLTTVLDAKTSWPFDALNDHGHSPLDAAILSQRPRSVLRLLIKHGANPALISSGTSFLEGAPLHIAAGSHPMAIPFLIEHGAGVNITNHDGLTPLMVASTRGPVDSLDLLLAQGADPNAQVVDSPITVLRAGMTALHFAVNTEGNAPVVQRLLDSGCDPRVLDSHGRTALTMPEAKPDSVAVLEAYFLQQFATSLDQNPVDLTPRARL